MLSEPGAVWDRSLGERYRDSKYENLQEKESPHSIVNKKPTLILSQKIKWYSEGTKNTHLFSSKPSIKLQKANHLLKKLKNDFFLYLPSSLLIRSSLSFPNPLEKVSGLNWPPSDKKPEIKLIHKIIKIRHSSWKAKEREFCEGEAGLSSKAKQSSVSLSYIIILIFLFFILAMMVIDR